MDIDITTSSIALTYSTRLDWASAPANAAKLGEPLGVRVGTRAS